MVLANAAAKTRGSSGRMVPAIHCIIVDTITDIPVFITTMAMRTYVNNTYISFDIAIKFLVFVRAVVWVPYSIRHENNQDQSRHNKASDMS